jgi:hypothetical protein
LPRYIGVSGEIQAGILTDQQTVVQVGDNLHSSETLINRDFQRFHSSFNRTAVVHHINGNRMDDRPANLDVVTKSEHCRIHNLEEPRLRDEATGKFVSE